jgi:hypothetical protein
VNGPSIGFKLGGSGDVTTTHMLWKQTKGMPYLSSALVYRGQYVMVKDGGIVTSYNAKTGQEVYQERAAAAGRWPRSWGRRWAD